jgi:cation transport ATPase
LSGDITLDESSFTGESYPVHKKTGDEVYSGTYVVNGQAQLEITYTGLKTKFGQLTAKVASMNELSFFKQHKYISHN